MTSRTGHRDDPWIFGAHFACCHIPPLSFTSASFSFHQPYTSCFRAAAVSILARPLALVAVPVTTLLVFSTFVLRHCCRRSVQCHIFLFVFSHFVIVHIVPDSSFFNCFFLREFAYNMANGKESDPALSTIAPEAPVTSERPVDVYNLGIPYPRMSIFFLLWKSKCIVRSLVFGCCSSWSRKYRGFCSFLKSRISCHCYSYVECCDCAICTVKELYVTRQNTGDKSQR